MRQLAHCSGSPGMGAVPARPQPPALFSPAGIENKRIHLLAAPRASPHPVFRAPSLACSSSVHLSGQSPMGTLPSLQGSSPGLKEVLSRLRHSLASLDHYNVNPRSSSPVLCNFSPSNSPSPSLRSSSPSLRSTSSSSVRSGSSSEDNSWDTNSWSSGATCLLRTSIKQHSDELFRARVGSPDSCGIADKTAGSDTSTENIYQTVGNCDGDCRKDGAESPEVPERGVKVQWDSSQSLSSSRKQGQGKVVTFSAQQERKLEERLKFSQFLDEVTTRVLVPGSPWESYNPVRQRELPAAQDSWKNPVSSSVLTVQKPQDPKLNCANLDNQWSKYYAPSCKVLNPGEGLKKCDQGESCLLDLASVGRTYLETDIDVVRRQDELEFYGSLEKGRKSETEREGEWTMRCCPEPLQGSFKERSSPTSCQIFSRPESFTTYPYCSTSLPRSVSTTGTLVPSLSHAASFIPV
ncbi:hypothetical protein DPEC_G00317700 [Dallia pectoralis]|uniref:Uncharacterized protein n=1 Tax=Dallia pectoralis TaxID=75939 RepID=A0ACC2FD45_DALPE|nr:hypothetical protein DPEC_G00317700 [Dallia pectoralis]